MCALGWVEDGRLHSRKLAAAETPGLGLACCMPGEYLTLAELKCSRRRHSVPGMVSSPERDAGRCRAHIEHRYRYMRA